MNTSRMLAHSALPVLVLGAALACGGEKAQREVNFAPTPQPTQQFAQKPQPQPQPEANVNIAEDIRKACGLSTAEARFAYNSAALRASETAVLKKLAECFTTGPLAGRKVLLIGRADPRGEEEYNMALGERRARSVANALVQNKLAQSQVQTSSRGNLDARGTDEAGWAQDRRVDVELGR